MDDSRNFLEYLSDPVNWDDEFDQEIKLPKKQEKNTTILPPIINGRDFPEPHQLIKRAPLVDGLFRMQDNVLLGAPSKMGKSWFYANLACSLASGTHFIDLETRKSKVLYIDLELHRDDFLDRLWRVCSAQGLKNPPENLWAWCLRDHEYDLDLMIMELDDQIDRLGGVDVIILDPIYMLGGMDFDENNANSVKHFLKGIASLKRKHNSALLLTHHFSKGNKGKEDHTDRFSGSGAFSRWPDSMITLSRHNVKQHAILEVTGRSMPRTAPFTVNMSPPAIRASDLKVEHLKL
jgi:RecA-family ATPase